MPASRLERARALAEAEVRTHEPSQRAPLREPDAPTPAPATAPANATATPTVWSRAISFALNAGRVAAVALPFVLAAQLAAPPPDPRGGAMGPSVSTTVVKFDRAKLAHDVVTFSKGAIREEPTPFAGSTLFVPTQNVKGAVLLLHGSEGGNQPYTMSLAADLALHGYAALAFAYFDVPGSTLPKHLVDVPLERTQAAADWLRARYGHVGLEGTSRGGEQALELASLDPEKKHFDAVAGEVPSSQIWGAWDQDKLRPIYDAHGKIRSAWVVNGAGLREGEPIAIENYPGPIYLRGSGRDDVWPSADYVKQLEARLQQHGRSAEVHILPRERHVLSPDAWRKASAWLVDFFDRSMPR